MKDFLAVALVASAVAWASETSPTFDDAVTECATQDRNRSYWVDREARQSQVAQCAMIELSIGCVTDESGHIACNELSETDMIEVQKVVKQVIP